MARAISAIMSATASPGPDVNSPAWHERSAADVVAALNSDEAKGLTQVQADRRLKEHGKNVLHTSATTELVARRLGIAREEVERLLASAHAKLFTVREKRVRPHRDEKVLTSWNGLMITGLARAASALGEERHAPVLAPELRRRFTEGCRAAEAEVLHVGLRSRSACRMDARVNGTRRRRTPVAL